MDNKRVWLSPPHLNGSEIEYIREAIQNNWVSPYGENIDEFESALEDYFEGYHVALVNSGTAAIHLSLILAGVDIGDEVIVPTLNFAGCINPILYQKAIPLFIDSEKETWNIDPEIVEDVIRRRIGAGKKPKAVVGVHLFGMPCKIDDLIAICEKYEIPFIEDAAEAMGSRYKARPTGTFGEMGVVSFNGNKIITTSGGGALISADRKLIDKAKYLSNQARQVMPEYVHDAVGYNYMMSNILAGIGRGQLTTLQDRISKRRQIFDRYKISFQDIEEIYFPDDSQFSASNRWLSVMLIENKVGSGVTPETLYHYLLKHNIESRPVWNPMHLQPAFKTYPYFGSNIAENLYSNGLCLPSGSSLEIAEQEYIIELIKKHFEDKAIANKSLAEVRA